MFERISLLINRIKIFLYLKLSGFKSLGRNIYIDFPVKIKRPSQISIGNDSVINAFVHIWGSGGVDIGNRVLIASHTSIISTTHPTVFQNTRFSENIAKQVIIEDDVWIGSHAVIMHGVTIGKRSIVAAGAVVLKDVPNDVIVGGVPAKILKRRSYIDEK